MRRFRREAVVGVCFASAGGGGGGDGAAAAAPIIIIIIIIIIIVIIIILLIIMIVLVAFAVKVVSVALRWCWSVSDLADSLCGLIVIVQTFGKQEATRCDSTTAHKHPQQQES